MANVCRAYGCSTCRPVTPHLFVHKVMPPRKPSGGTLAGKAYQPSPLATRKLQEFGRLLRAGRVRLNLTQTDLADQLGINRKTLERLEDGYPGAAWGLAVDVCLAVGFPAGPEWLSTEEKKALLEVLKTKQRAR